MPLAAAAAAGQPLTALAAPAPAADATGAVPTTAYAFLRPAEAAFAEALARHMVPEDALTADGASLGIPAYIDRALGSAWGAGAHRYAPGPYAPGEAEQGDQSPLAPSGLFRAGTAAFDAWCAATAGAPFHALDADAREHALSRLQAGRAGWPSAVSEREYFRLIHDLVREGLFADPLDGGNRGKAGWRLLGHPGVVDFDAGTRRRYRHRPYRAEPLGLADLADGEPR
nr:gluconate 2-dehydrogenase subunit 3 family protein [Luteimonas sp. Y-2-2-4F]